MSFALRQISAVLAPSMVAEFGLSNAQLGSLSSAYFVTFAAMQLPLGQWLDRYGSRRVNSVLLLFAVAGCVMHASATGYTQLWLGRALIGIGVSGGLMAALRAFRQLFAIERQQPLAAWMLSVGSLGALSTTLPVQWLLPILSWRGVFWVAAGLLLLSSAAMFFLLPKAEQTSDSGGYRAYIDIFKEPYVWRFGVLSIIVHGTFIGFQSLWIGPWLTRVNGWSASEAAQLLFAFTAVLMVGFLLLVKLSTMVKDHQVAAIVCIAATLQIVLFLVMALFQNPQLGWLWLLVAVAGVPFTLIQTHVALQFSAEQSGRALSAYNLIVFAGAFIAQWLFGVLVDFLKASQTEPQAFRQALIIWVGIEAIAIAVCAFWRVKPPSERTLERPI